LVWAFSDLEWDWNGNAAFVDYTILTIKGHSLRSKPEGIWRDVDTTLFMAHMAFFIGVNEDMRI